MTQAKKNTATQIKPKAADIEPKVAQIKVAATKAPDVEAPDVEAADVEAADIDEPEVEAAGVEEFPDGTAPAVGVDGPPAEPTDARERFRQALDRKNALPGSHPGSQSAPGAHLKGSNSKRKREFRRKSG